MTLAQEIREQLRMECGRRNPADCDNHDSHRLMGEAADALERVEALAAKWGAEHPNNSHQAVWAAEALDRALAPAVSSPLRSVTAPTEG